MSMKKHIAAGFAAAALLTAGALMGFSLGHVQGSTANYGVDIFTSANQNMPEMKGQEQQSSDQQADFREFMEQIQENGLENADLGKLYQSLDAQTREQLQQILDMTDTQLSSLTGSQLKEKLSSLSQSQKEQLQTLIRQFMSQVQRTLPGNSEENKMEDFRAGCAPSEDGTAAEEFFFGKQNRRSNPFSEFSENQAPFLQEEQQYQQESGNREDENRKDSGSDTRPQRPADSSADSQLDQRKNAEQEDSRSSATSRQQSADAV